MAELCEFEKGQLELKNTLYIVNANHILTILDTPITLQVGRHAPDNPFG